MKKEARKNLDLDRTGFPVIARTRRCSRHNKGTVARVGYSEFWSTPF